MRQFTDSEALSGIVREALGAEARVVGVDRLRGGSKKGVYRVYTSGSRAASTHTPYGTTSAQLRIADLGDVLGQVRQADLGIQQ